MSRRSAVRARIGTGGVPNHQARLSEWQEIQDLRPGSVSCVGSNPTPCRPLVYGLNIQFAPIV